MFEGTVAQICDAVAGRLVPPQGQNPQQFAGQGIADVVTDTRKAVRGALFVALRGEHFDGHNFLPEALQAGMAVALVDEGSLAQAKGIAIGQIVVADTLSALGRLAHWHRSRQNKPVVAITGSNGKTTTKELLAAALAARGKVHKTAGNLNNLIGLPMTLLQWPKDAWAAVVEMGMNAPGEIASLATMAAPNVGAVTCVAAAHLQGLGTLERVARAKAELFEHLPAAATAIVNGDDAILCAAAAPFLQHKLQRSFGTGAAAFVRLVASKHVEHGGAQALAVTFDVAGHRFDGTLPLVGQHNAMNAGCALACALALGLDAREALAAMAEVQVPGARGRILRDEARQLHIIDDCYNANPESMAAALATLKDLSRGQPTIAVLGDMLELGPTAQEHHRRLGARARATGVHRLYAFGQYAHEVLAGAGGAGAAFAADGLPELAQALADDLQAGTWILIKGSRGVRLERLVERLAVRAL